MSSKKELPFLTKFESEVMSILWKLGSGSVRDVLELLPRKEKVAYTSVATIIKILEDKGYLVSIKSGKAHTFKPLLEKKEYQKKTLKSLVDQFFGGLSSELVKNLVTDEKLSQNEREQIRKIIDEEL